MGRGGFGAVYRAWDPTVSRLVAIKILTSTGDREILTRFRNEAASAGKLNHENIVTIYDFGDENGPYLVMQLLDGLDLDKVIESRRPLTLIQKLEIILRANVLHGKGLAVDADRLIPFVIVKLVGFASRGQRSTFTVWCA